jgi:hypothetical protein
MKRIVVIISVMLICFLYFTHSIASNLPQQLTSVFLPLIIKPSTIPTVPPPTESPSPTQTLPPTPPSGLLPVGQMVRFDEFEGTIVEATKADRLEGDYGTIFPNQVFVVVVMDIKNLGFVSNSVSRYDLAIVDSLGRTFDMASLEAQWAAEEQFGHTGVYREIQPSFIERQVYAFDIALDSESLELIAATDPKTPSPNTVPESVVDINMTGAVDTWDYTITDVIKTSTLEGDYGTINAKGIFLVTLVTVKNTGTVSEYISRYDFIIQDNLTRQFDMASLEAQWAAEDQYERTGVYKTIQPSFSETQVYVFDISPSSVGLLFVPTEPGDAIDLGQ